MTYKYGGGCGHDLSVLRPGGDEILGTGGNSCGPVGFMNLFSENTNTIAQHGRRGANMQTLRVDHPDPWRQSATRRGSDGSDRAAQPQRDARDRDRAARRGRARS